MSANWTCGSSSWSREENKAFENALAIFSDDTNPMAKIAAKVPGRTPEEVRYHFEALVADVDAIESGLVPVPHYADFFKKSNKRAAHATIERKQKQLRTGQNKSSHGERLPQLYGNPRRAKPWSKDEHRLFLQGLAKFGRGDWRSISRFCVQSRTATQVASHAQKFFKRMDMPENKKKRQSVHDVTLLDDGRIITQQISATKHLGGAASSGSYTSYVTTGIDLLIDNGCNSSTPQAPLLEGTTESVDSDEFYNSLFDSLNDVSSDKGPSIEEITDAAGVRLFTPLFTSHQNISALEEPTGKEIVVSSGDDFVECLFSCQHDSSTPQVPMPGQVTGNDDGVGGSGINFWGCSSRYHPDFGANCFQISTQPVKAAPPGCSASPNMPLFDLYSPHMEAYFPSPPRDIAALIFPLPPSNRN